MIISRSPEVQWTVLDGEAVLLNLENGVYYTLNGVGTKICQLSAGILRLPSGDAGMGRERNSS